MGTFQTEMEFSRSFWNEKDPNSHYETFSVSEKWGMKGSIPPPEFSFILGLCSSINVFGLKTIPKECFFWVTRGQEKEEILHCNIKYQINVFYVKVKTARGQVGKTSSPQATKSLQDFFSAISHWVMQCISLSD